MDPIDVQEQKEREERSLIKHPKSSLTLHYHGEVVRRLFMAGGAALLVSIPLVRDVLPLNTSVLLILILLLAILAGITNPKYKWIIFSDVIVAALALIIFEYYAISGIAHDGSRLVIVVRQLLAINFFFALYFAAKTLRGALIR